jgi:methionyl-tRNA formyltransferase
MKSFAILTSEQSWFIPFAHQLSAELNSRGFITGVFHEYEKIPERFETVFILSYFKVIGSQILKQHNLNLVVHESNLPEGKGWAPLFWQILEGKNLIPVVLFEATEQVDSGDVYLKDKIELNGTELNQEIRLKQAEATIRLCINFAEMYPGITAVKQTGESTYYKRRTPKDSELDIDKTIREQFNLLRISENEEYPAFFYHKNQKYIIKIYKEGE